MVEYENVSHENALDEKEDEEDDDNILYFENLQKIGIIEICSFICILDASI